MTHPGSARAEPKAAMGACLDSVLPGMRGRGGDFQGGGLCAPSPGALNRRGHSATGLGGLGVKQKHPSTMVEGCFTMRTDLAELGSRYTGGSANHPCMLVTCCQRVLPSAPWSEIV